MLAILLAFKNSKYLAINIYPSEVCQILCNQAKHIFSKVCITSKPCCYCCFYFFHTNDKCMCNFVNCLGLFASIEQLSIFTVRLKRQWVYNTVHQTSFNLHCIFVSREIYGISRNWERSDLESFSRKKK